MGRNVESGLRNYRIEFMREPEYGEPGDESFLYSPVITNFTWSAESGNDPRRGLGYADPIEFVKSAETHEITLEYDLYKFFTDGDGNPYDASYDALARDVDNMLPNSHTIISREEKSNITADNTVNGTESRGTRLYSVAHGALGEEVTITGDTSDAGPTTVELTYMAEKARSYQVDQPDGSTMLEVSAENASDEGIDVTIADENGDNEETVTVGGTTTEEFEDIAAIWLAEEPEGEITVSEEGGVDLAVIHGAESYQDVEGDRGIPAPDTREEEVTESAEVFAGDTIYRGADPVEHRIIEASVTASNNLEEMEVSDSLGLFLAAGNRELEMEATMFGEKASHDMLEDSLQSRTEDQEWEMSSGSLILEGAVLQEPGERAAEEGEAVMTIDNTFEASGLTIE